MVRRDYNNCNACHADPSGGGLLNEYGRYQSANMLSTRYGPADQEPGKFKDAFFGLVPLPETLLVGGFFRGGYIWNTRDGKLADKRYLAMQADLQGQLTLGAFRVNASIGVAPTSSAAYSQRANVTSRTDGLNLVSREHWAGVDLAEQTILLRAGRINLPFGLRNVEHTSWVRSETRTDYNQGQQHGVAFAFNDGTFRTEVMGIAGNFQIQPDAYRERGYAGYFEWGIDPRHTIGVNSLVTYADSDLLLRVKKNVRQAHGLFTRLALIREVVVMAEANLLFQSPTGRPSTSGYVGFLQADVEPIQGVHVMATGEVLDRGGTGSTTLLGGWLSAAWFFLPHFDIRFDTIRRGTSGQPATMTYLAQLHMYL